MSMRKPKRPWTEFDDRVLELLAGKRPAEAIARATGHATITVKKRLKAKGLPAYHWTRRDWLLAEVAGLTMESP